MLNKEYFLKVIEAAEKNGLSREEFAKAIEPLSEEEAYKRVELLGQKLGIDQVQDQSGAYAAYQAGKPEASFTPDSHAEEGAFSQLARGAVEGLSEAGAVVGGVVGGSAAGAATMGTTAPVGAAIGATALGSVGKVLEEGIQKMLWPEIYGKQESFVEETKEGFKAAVGGAYEGAITEATGRTLPVALAGSAKATRYVSDKLASRTIPWARNISKSVIKKASVLLNDMGVITTKRTMAKLGKDISKETYKLGKALETGYETVDKHAQIKFRPQTIIDEVVDAYKKIRGNASVDKQAENKIIRFLKRQDTFNGKTVSHQGIFKTTKSVEEGLRTINRIDPDKGKFKYQLGLALRQVNEKLGRMAVKDPKVVDNVLQMSENYYLLKAADSSIKQTLKTESGVITKGINWLKRGAAYSAAQHFLGGWGPVVVGGYEAATSTAAKTTATMVTKFSSELLGKAAQMEGNYARMLFRVAASKGLDAVAKRHAHLMYNDEKYRDMVTKIWPEMYSSSDLVQELAPY